MNHIPKTIDDRQLGDQIRQMKSGQKSRALVDYQIATNKQIFQNTSMILFSLLMALCLMLPNAVSAETLVVIPKGVMFPFWQSVCLGATDAARKHGTTLVWRGPRVENKIDAQRYIIDLYTDREVEAIVVAPSHAKRLNQSIERAVSKGIKVVVIDSPVTTSSMDSYIATENYEAGKLGAKLLLKSLRPGGKVLLMGNVPGNASTDRREKGFIDHMRDVASESLVMPVTFNEGTYTSAIRAAESALSANPEISGIFAVNEVSSVAILDWLIQNQSDHIPFIAFDYSANLEKGIISGRIDALIAQSPYQMGYLGVEMALKAVRGEQVVSKVESPVFVLTKDNIKTAEIVKQIRLDSSDVSRCPSCFK